MKILLTFVVCVGICLACEAAGWHVPTHHWYVHPLRGVVAWLAAKTLVETFSPDRSDT